MCNLFVAECRKGLKYIFEVKYPMLKTAIFEEKYCFICFFAPKKNAGKSEFLDTLPKSAITRSKMVRFSKSWTFLKAN